MSDFKPGDRVKHATKVDGKRVYSRGTIKKHIRANSSGTAAEVCVIDWDDGTTTTLWAVDLIKEKTK